MAENARAAVARGNIARSVCPDRKSNNAAEGDEAKGKGRRVFIEGTLHSSYVFACLFSQCSGKTTGCCPTLQIHVDVL